MANPTSNKDAMNTDSTSKLRDMSERLSRGDTRDFSDASEMMDQASDTASQLYSQASNWMQQNSRFVWMAAAFVSVGVVGYLFGRNASQSSNDFSDIQSY